MGVGVVKEVGVAGMVEVVGMPGAVIEERQPDSIPHRDKLAIQATRNNMQGGKKSTSGVRAPGRSPKFDGCFPNLIPLNPKRLGSSVPTEFRPQLSHLSKSPEIGGWQTRADHKGPQIAENGTQRPHC